jgi:hypothetical protein
MVFCVNLKPLAVFVGTQGVRTFISKTFRSEVSSNQTLFSACRCMLDPYPSLFYRPCGCLIGGACLNATLIWTYFLDRLNAYFVLLKTSRHSAIGINLLVPSQPSWYPPFRFIRHFPSHHPLFCYSLFLVCCILYPYRIINSCFHHLGASRRQ